MQILRIFYRNRMDKDTKVLSWTTALTDPVIFNGNTMDHASNTYVLHVDVELQPDDLSYQAVNERGVFLKKIVASAIVDRDPADIAKDINNKAGMYQDCELAIAQFMGTREKVTWVSIAVKHAFLFLKSLQAAANVPTESLSPEGQQSLATLNWLNATINLPVEQLMIDRDAAIALLDQED